MSKWVKHLLRSISFSFVCSFIYNKDNVE